MEQNCTECGKSLRQVPAGVSKNTGRPYKAFLACPDRHKQATDGTSAQKQPQETNGKQNAALEMIYELREIRKVLEWIQLNMMQEGKGEIGKGFDTKKDEEIPVIQETGAPEPEGGYPF